MTKFLKIKNILVKVLTVAIIFSAGIYIGFNKQTEIIKAAGVNKEAFSEEEIDLSAFWKAWELIDEKYPDADKTGEQERIYGAISGLLDSLDDPYSVFLPPDEAKTFKDDIAGNFVGVGIEVALKDKILTVIAPLKNTPADRAGIQAGDKIVKIDGTSTTGLTIEKSVKLMRGEKGTPVVLTIEHEGEEDSKDITIIRDTITMPTLDAEVRSDGIFVIKLYTFSANSTGLFRNAIKQFVNTRSDKLVIDLRGNPGGYLSASVDMASWFLPGGQTVVIEDRGQGEEQKSFRSKGYNLFNENLKLVILIDDGSASASEILAGALQDYKKAKLVGEQSFGKGSVQEVIPMSQGSVIKITIAKWLTPNGVSISEKGLTPDYVVPLTAEDKKNKKDPQMDKAVELLKNWPQ
ncbi:S41 family peptidase [Candidatus Nomurabacteria bacterium]|nr:S41 family peptidase [Candidatus Nomurabacteria bacterium]